MNVRMFQLALALCLIAFASDVLTAQEVQATPPPAGIEYELQGEYSGEINSQNVLAVQVIALGDANFRSVGYVGGLPGDGWDGTDPERVEAKLEDKQVIFQGQHATGTLSDGQMVIADSEGNQLGILKKVHRRSKTLGKQPESDSVVLFNGQSADSFQSTKDGPAKMTSDGLLVQGANSLHRFGDCHLHIEFRLPFQPAKRGQGRGNSGVYLQGRYEVQMLDSFGLTGEHNECGGIYTIKKPDVNMCYPPYAWQTYDIDFTAAKFNEEGKKIGNARMTVKHNGVVIHDDVELPKTTTAAPLKETAEKGFLHLQDHGNPVRYRNIWLTEK